MRKTERAAGFGAIGVVLIVVVVVLVGLITWRVYDALKAKTTSSTTSQGSSSNQSNNGNAGSTQSTPQPTVTYLDIKEMGIKIKLDDSIKDATYKIFSYSDGSMAARFSTASLVAADPACGSDFGPLGLIYKSTTDTDLAGAKLVVGSNALFKLGSYYFTYESPQALCSDSEKASTILNTAHTAFRRSVTSIQADR